MNEQPNTLKVTRGGWMPYLGFIRVACCWELCPDSGVIRQVDTVLAVPMVGEGVMAMPALHCASCGMQMLRQPYLTRDQQAAQNEDYRQET